MKKVIIAAIVILITNISLTFAQKRNVLFIGNSYTAGMPTVVEQISGDLGDTLNMMEVSPGGYTLQGHSTDPATLSAIKQQKWDIVVLQEQSQRPSFSPGQVATDVFPYAKTLDGQIKANNSCTETMFYMTWGRKNGDQANCASYPPICTYNGMQKRLRESYMQMAKDNNGVVSPVGATWKVVRDSVPSINLYSPDESHPSAAGTYLTACVFYASIFHKSPVGCKYTAGLSTTDAGKLQYYAAKVVLDSLNQWMQNGDYVSSGYTYTVSGSTVNFKSTSINATNYNWTFGDGTNSTQPNPSKTYTAKAKYEVTLTSTNNCFNEKSIDSVDIRTVGVNSINKTEANITLSSLGNQSILIIAPNSIGNRVTLYTIDGRKVKSVTITRNRQTIQLQPGIYLYSVSENGHLVSKGKVSNY